MIANLIWWILVGLIAGWAAGKIMRGGGYGPAMDIVLGIVGAVVGGWLMGMLGIYAGGFLGTILIAIIGAVFLGETRWTQLMLRLLLRWEATVAPSVPPLSPLAAHRNSRSSWRTGFASLRQLCHKRPYQARHSSG